MRRLVLVLSLVALAGVGFLSTYMFMRSPSWSLYQIGKAIHERDSNRFLAYVDVGRILHSQKDDILDLLLPDKSKSQQRDVVRQLISAFMAPLTEQVRDRIVGVIKDPERDNLPSSWALLAVATVTSNGDSALVLLSDPGKDQRLRLGMRRDEQGYWRVVEVNSQDLRVLAERYLLPAGLKTGQATAPAPAPAR